MHQGSSTDNCSESNFSPQIGNNKDAMRKTWNPKFTLRSHFDGIRALSFHPVEPVLITASEDHTLKMWNLQKTAPAKKWDMLNNSKITSAQPPLMFFFFYQFLLFSAKRNGTKLSFLWINCSFRICSIRWPILRPQCFLLNLRRHTELHSKEKSPVAYYRPTSMITCFCCHTIVPQEKVPMWQSADNNLLHKTHFATSQFHKQSA